MTRYDPDFRVSDFVSVFEVAIENETECSCAWLSRNGAWNSNIPSNQHLMNWPFPRLAPAMLKAFVMRFTDMLFTRLQTS
jgi:hypothetical protein